MSCPTKYFISPYNLGAYSDDAESVHYYYIKVYHHHQHVRDPVEWNNCHIQQRLSGLIGTISRTMYLLVNLVHVYSWLKFVFGKYYVLKWSMLSLSLLGWADLSRDELFLWTQTGLRPFTASRNITRCRTSDNILDCYAYESQLIYAFKFENC